MMERFYVQLVHFKMIRACAEYYLQSLKSKTFSERSGQNDCIYIYQLVR